MALRKISTCKTFRGFTLIEVLVVVALLVSIAGFGLIVSMESYRDTSFRSERDALVAALQEARSQSMQNMCFGACSGGEAHGVHLGEREYVIFQGASYDTRDASVDELIPVQYGGFATTSPSSTDIVFSQLAGTTTANPSGVTTISLVDTEGISSSTITVSPEGQITWTN